MTDTTTDDYRGLEAVTRLSRDLKKAAQTLSPDEARYLVDAYYQMQGDRIRSTNQVRALTASEEPHQTIAWLADNAGVLERSIREGKTRIEKLPDVLEGAPSVNEAAQQ